MREDPGDVEKSPRVIDLFVQILLLASDRVPFSRSSLYTERHKRWRGSWQNCSIVLSDKLLADLFL